MRNSVRVVATALGLGLAMASIGLGPVAAQTPKMGGTLKFVVPAEPPSFDGHRETTFALIHPIAPFYSVLIRVDPNNPASTTDFVCDLCTEMATPTDDGKKYTFKIRQGVKFHDGSALTAQDILATYQKIINPPKGVGSARKAFYSMVEKVSAPDDHTVVFDLKYLGRGQDPWGNERAGFSATVTIDRADYGLNWNEVLETGGVLVGNEVEIRIDVEGLLAE